MRELSIFVDESGADGLDSNYYLLTLVLHEQDRPIDSAVEPYERALGDKRLPNIPFHMSPLLNGHDEYEGMSSSSRASLLSSFMLLFHHLPIRYKTFSYRKRARRWCFAPPRRRSTGSLRLPTTPARLS